MKNIVLIGGGTGTFTLLSGLKLFPAHISVIVSTADDGGSTGRLRKDLNVMPPGDIRQCLLGLSQADENLKKLFSYRFDKGVLAGQNAGNIIIAALEKVTGDTQAAIAICSRLLHAKGEVLPVTLNPTSLKAVLEDGVKISGEHNIDEPASHRTSPIKSIFLSSAKANPRAAAALKQADLIVLGPGDLYTSVLPNLLVKEVRQAILLSKAKLVFVTNIMTKHGQTDGFKASDFINTANKYIIPRKIDYAIINNKKPSAEWMKRYKREKAEFVMPDVGEINKLGAVSLSANLLSSNTFSKQNGDVLKRSYLRHDAEKAAEIIWQLLK